MIAPKSGWRTTEFWAALAAMGLGGWFVYGGRAEIGAALTGGVAVGYGLVRALEKRAAHAANGEVHAAATSSRGRTI